MIEYILYPGHELCSYLSFFWEDRSSNDPGLSLFFDYIQDSSPHLRWFLEETTGRPRRFNHEDARAFCERQIRGSESSKESGGFAVAAYGSIEKKGVSPWTALAQFQVRTIGTHLLATWPLAESPTWDQLAMRLERTADSSLILAHGGLTYSYSAFRGHNSGARHAILPRYWGIDPPEPLEDAFAARNGCRSPSWLSYVPTEKLDRIAPEVLKRLPPELVQTQLPHGTLFRLGPEPILGDQNRGEAMPLHRALARALRPIRGKLTHWTNSTSYEYPAWVARFDDPDDAGGSE